MAEPIGALRAELSANAAQFEADMKRAREAVRSSSSRMQRSMRDLGKRFDSAVKSLFSFRTAAVAAASATGLGLLAARIARTSDQLVNHADKLGIGVEALQEYRFAARQVGIEQGTVDLALQRFTRRAAEAAQGTGEAKGALEELGVQLLDNQGRLRPMEALLDDVADAFTKIESPADRLRIAFKLFDSEGAGMVNVLARGSAGLNELRRQAQDLGAVISEDTARKAAQFNGQLEVLKTILQARLAENMGRLVPVIVGLANAAITAAPKIAEFADVLFNLITNSEQAQVSRRISALREEIRSLEDDLRAINENSEMTVAEPEGFWGRIFGGGRKVREKVGHLRQEGERQRIQAILDERRATLDELERELARIIKEKESGAGSLLNANDFLTAATEGEEDSGGVTIPKRSKINRRAISEAESNAREFERAIQAKHDNISRTLASAIRGGAEDGAAGMAEALLRSLQNNFINQAADALTSLFSQVGGGGFGGFIGSIFGGRRAFGGPVMPGKAYLVGERGPEVMVSKGAGQVIPNSALRSSGVQVNVINNGEPLQVTGTQEQSVDGQQIVDVMVERSVGKMFATGSMDRMFAASGMGVKRRGHR